MSQTVHVAVWDHESGIAVRAFETEGQADAWREEIADEFWEQEFDDERPAENVGEEYFDRMSIRHFAKAEHFHVYETRIEPVNTESVE